MCNFSPYVDVRCVAPDVYAPHDATFQVRVWKHPEINNRQVLELFDTHMPVSHCDSAGKSIMIQGCPESVLTDDMLVCDVILAPAVAACDLSHEHKAELRKWLVCEWWDWKQNKRVSEYNQLQELRAANAPAFKGKASRAAYTAAFNERCQALFNSTARPDCPPQQDHVAPRQPRKLRRR